MLSNTQVKERVSVQLGVMLRLATSTKFGLKVIKYTYSTMCNNPNLGK